MEKTYLITQVQLQAIANVLSAATAWKSALQICVGDIIQIFDMLRSLPESPKTEENHEHSPQIN
jgi:hypothetical protein